MLFKLLSRLKSDRGVVALAIVSISTLWLVANNQLGLYIHPRYYLFASIMSLISIVGIAFTAKTAITNKKIRAADLALLAILAMTFFSLALTQPATLSSQVALQRGVNSGSDTGKLEQLENIGIYSPFGDSNLSRLSVKELAGLIEKVDDPDFYENKDAQAIGFITKDNTNHKIFFVSRFVVSCCAVDAQPVGVPVYKPNWSNAYQDNQWVHVKGQFEKINQRIVLQPSTIKAIEQPEDPYVY